MSTTQSSSLPRAYIGSRRNRQYINNHSTSATLSNDYFSSSEAIQSEHKTHLLNAETVNSLQTQEEEQAPVKYLSSTIPLVERELQPEQKAKDFSSASSSSIFLFHTADNVTPLSDSDHSLPSFANEQQHFHHPSLHYEQLWNANHEQNSSLSSDKLEQQKQSFTSNQSLDLNDVPGENNSLSSTYSLDNILVDSNLNDNPSHLLTSTPILSSHLPSQSYYQTTNNNVFASYLTDKNNSNKPLTLNSVDEHSSTVGLITDLQRKADVCQLNNMSSSSSSLRYSSNLGTGIAAAHPYDQCISDQGNKYIIQLKTDEFQETDFTLTPRYSFHQLIIEGKHREEDSTGGYIHRELRKIFNIPKHIDLNQYTYSYNKQAQELTIELPYLQASSITNENHNDISLISPILNTTDSLIYSSEKLDQNTDENLLSMSSIRSDGHSNSNYTSGIGTAATDSVSVRNSSTAAVPTYQSSFGKTKPFDFDLFHRSAFRPQLVRAASNDHTNNNNQKKLLMSLDLSDYQAEDIKVSIKDRELIVKAERKIETDRRKSRTSFFQSTSLPPQTDIEHLQSNYNEGKLIIEAPYLEQTNTSEKVKTTGSNQGTHW